MKTLTCPRTSGPRNRKPKGGLGVEGLDADAVDEDDLPVPRNKRTSRTAHAQRASAGSGNRDQPPAAARLATFPNGI